MSDESVADNRGADSVSEQPEAVRHSSLITHHSSLSSWLERGAVACLFLFAVAAPHSIAAAQGAWVLGGSFWVARFFFRPRPKTYRTPVDPWLLGFFVLTFLTALTSYDVDVSIGKLRAASLYTIVYLTAENVRDPKMLRALALTLVASCALGVVHTFGVFAAGRGVKALALAADSPLRAAGVEEGDTILSVDGAPVNNPEEVERAVETERPSADKVYRWPDGTKACTWDERAACVRVYRAEVVPAFNVARGALPAGETPGARLGILGWSRGRDERASGFYGQYQTYSEVLQLVASLALGLLVALRRKASLKGALVALALAGVCGALLLTLTRASWAGFLLSALTILLVGAGRRTLL